MKTKTNVENGSLLPWAPKLPHLHFRKFRGRADYPAMTSLLQHCMRADQLNHIVTLEDIKNSYEYLTNCDPVKDMILVEVRQALIGYARVYWEHRSDDTWVYTMVGFVDPDWRGKGIGTALLRFTEIRAREIAAEHPRDRPGVLQAQAEEKQLPRLMLLERNGYEPTRFFFDMTRDLNEPIPDVPLPPGLEIRSVHSSQYRAIFEAANEAFQDHWGHSPIQETDYQAWQKSRHFQPDLWEVAWEGDQVAGMVLNYVDREENQAFQRQRGYTEDISVRRPWRRRGLARALLTKSLAAHKGNGMTEAALGVDTKNPTGALRLYESVGFQVVNRATVLQKPLDKLD